jgi:hypothetical protein
MGVRHLISFDDGGILEGPWTDSHRFPKWLAQEFVVRGLKLLDRGWSDAATWEVHTIRGDQRIQHLQ